MHKSTILEGQLQINKGLNRYKLQYAEISLRIIFSVISSGKGSSDYGINAKYKLFKINFIINYW